VFVEENVLYRSVTEYGEPDYQHLMSSGLYASLTADGLLVDHEDVGTRAGARGPERLLRPTPVPLVSYQPEWCFSQLKDAARLTLSVMRKALAFGMRLKDATADNVQCVGSRPVFIDTLSFERAAPGPWPAYRQFCQHFLAPLALMSRVDPRLGQLGLAFPDGIPLDLASRLLPRTTLARLGLLAHIHLHAAAEQRLKGPRAASNPAANPAKANTTPAATLRLLDHLQTTIDRLTWEPRSYWLRYYESLSRYTEQALDQKEALLGQWLDRVRPRVVWDIGANIGRFSRVAARQADLTVAIDSDLACVERLYLQLKTEGPANVLSLVVDIANPSPGLGWANSERRRLEFRGPADLVLALALVHHLSIAGNVPLANVAQYLARLGRALIIEFVPRDDPAIAEMAELLARRPLIEAEYSREGFERAFEAAFRIEVRQPIADTGRVLYLMERR
jgi:hypothetical protein